MKKLISLLTILCLIFALSACGASQQEEPAEDQSQETAEDQAAEEDGQNPAMNFVGVYGSGRASVLIECDGMD